MNPTARRPGKLRCSMSALCLGALSLGTPGFAQSLLQQAPKTGLYLQLGVGQSWQDSPANTGNPAINLNGSGTATAGKITAGLQITPMWGAELSYYDLGKVGINTPAGVANYDTNVTTVTATASYPLTQSLTLVGRAGVGYSHLQLNVPSQNYVSSSTKYPLVGGLGLRYNFTPRLALTVDYDYLGRTGRFDGGDSTTGQVLSAGLLLRY
ncbi:MAG: hypothetical protein EPN79_03015 [Burkholderiaceae bacterium]|nr:MAG: hypothetical protein EPN79_03015 [Burkholderiaceae bacterium]TBR77547.1 MAG: hypothetical protein EPN64_01540 [Burkholderiaceae bacterium]